MTRLADGPVEAALHLAREIAGRGPHAVRSAKKLINHLSNDHAKEYFALERETIFKLIGSPNQLEREVCFPKSAQSDACHQILYAIDNADVIKWLR